MFKLTSFLMITAFVCVQAHAQGPSFESNRDLFEKKMDQALVNAIGMKSWQKTYESDLIFQKLLSDNKYAEKIQTGLSAAKQDQYGSNSVGYYPSCMEILTEMKNVHDKLLNEEVPFWNAHRDQFIENKTTPAPSTKSNSSKKKDKNNNGAKTPSPQASKNELQGHYDYLNYIANVFLDMEGGLIFTPADVIKDPGMGFEEGTYIRYGRTQATEPNTLTTTYATSTIADLWKKVSAIKTAKKWNQEWQNFFILSDVEDFFQRNGIKNVESVPCWGQILDIVPVVDQPAQQEASDSDEQIPASTLVRLALLDEKDQPHIFMFKGIDLLGGMGNFDASEIRPLQRSKQLLMGPISLTRCNKIWGCSDSVKQVKTKFYNIAVNTESYYVGDDKKDNKLFLLGESLIDLPDL